MMSQTIKLYEGWSTGRKISFRYISIFFFLFILPFPLDQIPWLSTGVFGAILQAYYNIWNGIITWAGNSFFGIQGEVASQATGSGDKTYDWIQMFVVLCITFIGGTLWSVLDWKRESYSRLWRWFYLLLVYNLAYWMLVYGLIKVFGGQFSAPPLSRLMETFGESSPMRIMWTFMGSSESYVHFSGWSETIAGLLLLFRRTRTIGGLAAAGVMLNVFMMNMSYDVPVKLFSFRLMLAGAYIALVDGKRLFNVFLFNKPVPNLEWKPLFSTGWKRIALGVVQVVIISNILYSMLAGRLWGATSPQKPALYGIYDIDTFVINGDTLPPLLTDNLRWKKAFLDYPGYSGQLFGIKRMDDNIDYLTVEFDSLQNRMMLANQGDTVKAFYLDYRFENDVLTMDGVIRGDSLHIEGSYFNPDDFVIRSRGFNWINEVPYNRRVPYRH